MGDVYLAREHTSERVVAIKFLRATHNPIAIDRFLTEVRALGRIDHPHIVRALATDFNRSDPFYTMEFVAGGTLADRVKANGPLTSVEAAGLIAAAARAVHAGHVASVLHRDIKPSNILIAADGSPRVSDFGLAKRTDRDDENTLGSGPLGTPAFMPPEQVSRKHGEIGPQADVYGLGATLYYLVTGQPPFKGDSAETIITQVAFSMPERPHTLRADVPMELEGIIFKSMEKSPADRYPSAAALADDLDLFLAGQQPHAPKLTRTRRARRWVGRHRASIGLGALALVCLATGLALMPRSVEESKPDPLVEIQKELSEGKRVVLVGPTGRPRWHSWRLGAAVLDDSSTGDRTCSFQTQGLSLLDLLPDIDRPSYRFSAEIQHVNGSKNGLLTIPDRVGIHFGAAEFGTETNIRCLSQFIVWFKDHKSLNTGQDPKLVPVVEFRPFLFAQRGRLPDQHAGASGGSIVLEQNERWPGRWRRIVVEVTPDSLHVQWQKESGEMESFIRPGPWARQWTSDGAREMYAKLQTPLNNYLDSKVLVPGWHSRLALGIVADQSTVAFRNVTIEPLPFNAP